MEKNKKELQELGFTFINSFLDCQFIKQINRAIKINYKSCRKIQIDNGIDSITEGTAHHLLTSDDMIFIETIEKICNSKIYDFLKDYFDGNFIINSYGGFLNLSYTYSYVNNVHRDIRFFSDDFPLMINMLIMLDDFTIENGATYLLRGSHKIKNKPTDEEFYQNADRALGKRGDILLFNSNLWHAAGINNTDRARRAITITLTKPFVKQQLDYPRAIGYDKLEKMNSKLKQVIGFFSRTPSNLNEWYQKPENRFYRPGQD